MGSNEHSLWKRALSCFVSVILAAGLVPLPARASEATQDGLEAVVVTDGIDLGEEAQDALEQDVAGAGEQVPEEADALAVSDAPDVDEAVADVLTAQADNEITSWRKLQQAFSDGWDNIRLTQDIVAEAGDGPLTVENYDVVLDLNGHTINRALTQGVADGSVIKIISKNSLTINDSSAEQTGKITGGNTTGCGGGIHIDYYGTLVMNGGTITGNVAVDPSVNGNAQGGGVYISRGKFIMRGGAIRGNIASGNGGGVYVLSKDIFTLSGGAVITDNIKRYTSNGNTVPQEQASNVHLASGAIITMGGSFTGSVGVRMTKNGKFTSGLNGGDISGFSCDSSPDLVIRLVNGEANILPTSIVAIADGITHGTVVAEPRRAVLGDTVILTVTPDPGYSVRSVTYDGNAITPVEGVYSFQMNVKSGKVTVSAEFGSPWSDLQAALNAGGTVTLTEDVTASPSDIYLIVPSGMTATLDLAGHTLSRGLAQSEAVSDGYVIRNEGTLTITDSSAEQTGTITGGNTKGDVGGIWNGGTLTMENVNVYGNRATGSGGGIYNDVPGTLVIRSGRISSNAVTTFHGGGVYNKGTLSLLGGTIRDNSAGHQGGGILNNGTMRISGSPVVVNNGASLGNNIYLRGDHPTMTVVGELTDGANLYVTKAANETGPITRGYSSYNTTQPSAFFHADDTSYVVSLVDGEAYIGGEAHIDNAVKDIPYVSYAWSGEQLESVEKATDNTWMAWPDSTNIPAGQYVLNRDVTVGERVLLQGDTSIVLVDGCELNVKGLSVPADKTLTIYGQTEGTGKLVTTPSAGVGIGGWSDNNSGNIVIHGGTIEATGGDNAAGIGSSDGRATGDITIYNGTVTATGGSNGAGVGGGRDGGATVTIFGGKVTATGGNEGGAGIGSGTDGGTSYINIYGGEVEAKTASSNAVGMGNSDNGKGTSIMTFGYTDATGDDISITSPSYGGTVTLEKDFMAKDSETLVPAGQYDDNATQLAGKTLVRAVQHTVIFDADDGSAVASQTVISGQKATRPADPTREGFTFKGWTLRGVEYNFDAIVTEDITLKAVWVANRTLAVYSVDTNLNGSVANVAVDPMKDDYAVGETVTVTAESKDGYTFLGWYEVAEVVDSEVKAYGSKLSDELAYTFQIGEDDANLVAVYKASAKASVTIDVRNGAKYTVDEHFDAIQSGAVTFQAPIGKTVTVVANDASKVLQWENENGKVVGRGASLDVVVTGTMRVTLAYDTPEESQAFVQFLTDYDQVVSAAQYKSTSTIAFPDGPSKFGYVFRHWRVEGQVDEATQESIRGMIAEGTKVITLKPLYEQDGLTGTVTVKYMYGDTELGSETFADVPYGTVKTLIADAEKDGYKFKCWAEQDGTVLGYDPLFRYPVAATNRTLVAEYADAGEEYEAVPTISVTEVSALESGGKKKVSCVVTRSVPEGWELVEHGVLYGKDVDASKLTPEAFVYTDGSDGIKRYKSNDTARTGNVRANYPVDDENAPVSWRGFMVLRKDGSEGLTFAYSDIVTKTYASLKS